MMIKRLWILLLLITSPALAGEVDVVKVTFSQNDAGDYRFDVTLRHADEGWNHYANKWEIVAPDNSLLATRVLHHPHVNEQPFTRSLDGINIPEGINAVTLQGHDSVHGYGGETIRISLP